MVEKKPVHDSAGKKTDDAGVGEKEVQARFDEEQEQGYRGFRADPTPHEHYTVPGVLAGKPTPETDESAAHRAAQHEL
jgi:hypothetical protein